MKLKLILFTLFSQSLLLFSQANYAKPEEYKDIQKRPLIVELIDEDTEKLEKWEKKRDKARKDDKRKEFEELISEYKTFISNYNQNIEELAKQFFSNHSEILVKSTKEIEELRKKKSKKYTVLFYSESNSGKDGASDDVFIRTINYSRIEEGEWKVDHSMFIIGSTGGASSVTKANIFLTLQQLTKHIEYVIKTGKKSAYIGYAKTEGKQNNAKLKGKEIVIGNAYIDEKSSIKEIQDSYKNGTVSGVSKEAFEEKVFGDEETIVGVIMPWNIAVQRIGILTKTVVTAYKMFINTKTGEIIETTGIKTTIGGNTSRTFTDKDFKKL